MGRRGRREVGRVEGERRRERERTGSCDKAQSGVVLRQSETSVAIK